MKNAIHLKTDARSLERLNKSDLNFMIQTNCCFNSLLYFLSHPKYTYLSHLWMKAAKNVSSVLLPCLSSMSSVRVERWHLLWNGISGPVNEWSHCVCTANLWSVECHWSATHVVIWKLAEMGSRLVPPPPLPTKGVLWTCVILRGGGGMFYGCLVVWTSFRKIGQPASAEKRSNDTTVFWLDLEMDDNLVRKLKVSFAFKWFINSLRDSMSTVSEWICLNEA